MPMYFSNPSNSTRLLAVAEQIEIASFAFITPILPMITNIEELAKYLPKSIPIHLDKLRISKNTKQAKRFLSFIKKHFYQHYFLYLKIINNGDESYFQKIKEKYQNNNRYIFDFE